MTRSPRRLLLDGDLGDLGEPWELLVEVRIALRCDLALVWPLTIPAVESVHDVHATAQHLAEGREVLVVEVRIVFVVDEELGCASVWARIGKSQPAPEVGLLDHVVLDRGKLGLRHGWQAELRDKA